MNSSDSGSKSQPVRPHPADAHLRSTPGNVTWGLIPANAPPVLRIASGQTVRIWSAQALDEPAGNASPPGSIIKTSPAGIDVATGHGILRLTKLQLPGGCPLAAGDFLNAHNLDGQTFHSSNAA